MEHRPQTASLHLRLSWASVMMVCQLSLPPLNIPTCIKIVPVFIPSPNNKILCMSNLKAFADEKIVEIYFGKDKKHFWKMLATSILSFYHNVFKRRLVQDNLTLSQNKPWFLRVCSRTLLKTLWEKEKLLITSNFSFSHSVFYLLEELSAIFIKVEIVVSKLLQFGRV